MTDLEKIRARDAESGAIWFTGPASFTAQAARDRRTLLGLLDAQLEKQEVDLRGAWEDGECPQQILADLELLRRHHHVEDQDCWYSCPKSGQCCNNGAGTECNCGADSDNARLDRIITTLRGKWCV